MTRTMTIVLGFSLWALCARADEPPSSPPPPPELSAAAPAPGCEQYTARYQAAVDLLAQRNADAAARELSQIVAACPSYPGAVDLLKVARAQASASPAGAPSSAVPAAVPTAVTEIPANMEVPTGGARTELVMMQGFHGAVQGGLLSSTLHLDNPLLLMIAGATAFGGISIVLSAKGVTSGEAMWVDAGSLWGILYGLSMAAVINDQTFNGGIPIVAGLLGTGAAALLLGHVSLTAGRVALMNTAMIWTAGLIALTMAAFNVRSTAEVLLPMMLAAAATGTAAFWWQPRWHTSRMRAFAMDGGGLFGLLVGFGISSAANLYSGSGPNYGLLPPVVAGLGGVVLGAVLSQGLEPDAEPPPLSMAISPSITPRGGPAGALVGRF